MNSWIIPAILSVSIFLQLASALSAIILIRKSGFYKPWFFIAAAITLMAVRRITSLRNMVVSGVILQSELGPELIALLISILMLTGLLLFRPAFSTIRVMQERSKAKMAEKDLLVRESHHHVKNDLQMLAGMVRIQQDFMPQGPVQSFLKDLELRIQSFTLLHDYVYSGVREKSLISEYIRQLVEIIKSVYSSFNPSVQIQLDLSDFEAERKEMLYCGLIMNEAITNAYKYAFPEGAVTSPVITIQAYRNKEKRIISITDNGIGLPDTLLNITDNGSQEVGSNCYGLTLIQTIGESTDCSASVQSPASSNDNGLPGTTVIMEF